MAKRKNIQEDGGDNESLEDEDFSSEQPLELRNEAPVVPNSSVQHLQLANEAPVEPKDGDSSPSQSVPVERNDCPILSACTDVEDKGLKNRKDEEVKSDQTQKLRNQFPKQKRLSRREQGKPYRTGLLDNMNRSWPGFRGFREFQENFHNSGGGGGGGGGSGGGGGGGGEGSDYNSECDWVREAGGPVASYPAVGRAVVEHSLSGGFTRGFVTAFRPARSSDRTGSRQSTTSPSTSTSNGSNGLDESEARWRVAFADGRIDEMGAEQARLLAFNASALTAQRVRRL